MDEEEKLSALVLDHLVEVLRLTQAAVSLADLPEAAMLDQLEEIMTIWQRLEVSTVLLLTQAGLSWEAMAARSGVRRQSLHRRLSRKIKSRADAAASIRKTEGRGLQTEWRNLIELLNDKMRELMETDPTSYSAEIAQALLSQRQ